MARRSALLRRMAGVGALTVLALGGTAGASYAIGEYHVWNKKETPLKEASYGSTAYAYGKWRIYNGSNGTTSKVYSYSRLAENADDHKVYVELKTQANAGYCIAPKYTTCDKEWYHHATAETTHHTSSSYKYYKAYDGVPGDADYARGAVRTSIDIPYRPDTHSGTSYTQGSEY